FGQYRLNLSERLLLGPDGAIELSARSFDILALLLSRPDEVIRKTELLETVWPGLVVEENTPQVHMSALRKALGAGMVMTVHGRGYKFTGPRPAAIWSGKNGENADGRRADDQTHPMLDLKGGRTVPVTGGCLCGAVRYLITGSAI